jgi:hypothetical protein
MRSLDIPIVHGIKLAGRSIGSYYNALYRGKARADGPRYARTIPAREVERLLTLERETLTRKMADHERRWDEFQQLLAGSPPPQNGKPLRPRIRNKEAA